MLYKLTTTRVYRSYLGGVNIDAMTGVQNPSVTRFPEDWLASVTTAFNPGRVIPNEGLSKTESGEYLKDIINANKEAMLGAEPEMKLLFKLLDAAERLVIQVHPTIPFAKKYFNSPYGKTECWYILNDGGYVYLGFKPGITKERWKSIFLEQDIDAMLDCLHKFEVCRGDMIFVEGGVPHAIGKGCFLAELQEPTDLMVVTERQTPSGVTLKEEKLHGGLGFEKMFDCFTYEGLERETVKERYFLRTQEIEAGRMLLVGENITDKFRLEKMTVSGNAEFKADTYGIVLVTEGSGVINHLQVRRGDRLFVPANEKTLHCQGKMEILFCSA